MKFDQQTIKNTFILLRIPFSIYLMPVYFFAVSQTEEINWTNASIVFLILHLLVYPASNGYNSYMDRDTESIGGIEKPPLPSNLLFWFTLAMDFMAVNISLFLLNTKFTILMVAYILMSRAYSYKGIRLKKYPIPGFLTVFIFQGFVTFWMVSEGISTTAFDFFSTDLIYPAIATSFMIGGAYPMSQIYQHKQDAESGDQSISMLLGIKGTFYFGMVLFGIAGGLLFYYFEILQQGSFLTYILFLLPLLLWFQIWMIRTFKDENEASFHNLMRMNNISAFCMNFCYIFFAIQNHLDFSLF
ncbi:UbiA family prenyltransferase [Flammeovirga aprica]|uniref:UbiA family prenyltransferase n=1 Tax=Flammeovirga aprica JL-4 TaxID=694437 RepID=A0A7X9RTF8_9BACT|nr:UbiA family prenyltransferase [Flammeovirga aprica]NME68445.1 UbiA family prenyltransferase [Flammeovirga aprica JL-4]